MIGKPQACRAGTNPSLKNPVRILHAYINGNNLLNSPYNFL